MSQTLVPCPSCARHVLATESSCPFCSASLPEDPLGRAVNQAIRFVPRHLPRAAAWVVGASLAVASCSGEVTIGQSAGATSGGQGGAGADSGPDDEGGIVPFYGAVPPPDASNDGGGPPPEDGGMDAPEEDGSFNGPYGSPPPPPKDGG